MGLFSFLTPRYEPVPPEKLPKNSEKLRKLYQAARSNEDYTSVVAILEKIASVDRLSSNERETLTELYVEGRGCPQDLDKARDLVYNYIGAPLLHQLSSLFFLTAGHKRHYYPDYDRILSMYADFISQRLPCSYYDERGYKFTALNFSLMRDLAYLLELGLKDIHSEDELRDFLSAYNSDWAVRFYGACLFPGHGGFTLAGFDRFLNEDSLVAMDKLAGLCTVHHSSSGSLSDYRREVEEKKRYYTKLLHRFEYPEQGVNELSRKFAHEHHTSPMTAQEVLDTVRAEAAAMAATFRAQEDAKKLAEAKKKEEEERQHQQALASLAGRLKLAESCLWDDDFDGAEAHLSVALVLSPVTDEDTEAGIAIWGALAQLYQKRGDLTHAMQFAVTFFDQYHQHFPEDQTWAKYRADALNLVPKALYFVFDHYKHGPRHEVAHLANDYLSSAAEVFSDAYCTALRPRADSGDQESGLELALHLLNKGEKSEGAAWLKSLARAGHVPSMYFAAAEYPSLVRLSATEARSYLMRVATSGDPTYADMAKMVISTADLKAAKDKAFKQAAQEYVQTQRQAEVSAKMDEYREKLDLLERDLHLAFSGDGSTVEERILRGDFSPMDAIRAQELRQEVEARAREKFSKG